MRNLNAKHDIVLCTCHARYKTKWLGAMILNHSLLGYGHSKQCCLVSAYLRHVCIDRDDVEGRASFDQDGSVSATTVTASLHSNLLRAFDILEIEHRLRLLRLGNSQYPVVD